MTRKNGYSPSVAYFGEHGRIKTMLPNTQLILSNWEALIIEKQKIQACE